MDNIFHCKRCQTTFIAEEFDGHVCTPKLTEVKFNEFDYYYVTKDEMNREVITVKAMDGTMYSFVKRDRKESDKVPYEPTNLQQPNRTPDKGNTTKKFVSLIAMAA